VEGSVAVPYPQAFLDLQLVFAGKMAALSDMPYADAVLRNTALYRILGLDWSFDPRDPVWQRFLAELGPDGAEHDAGYRVYAERHAQGLIPDHDTSRPHWGCFSYEYDPTERSVRMHFADLDTSGVGPLSSVRKDARLTELRALFADIHQRHPEAERVRGGTWLYNREEYRRLFPKEYGDSARVDHPHLIARGLWGQFLRHGNRMNDEIVAQLLARVAALRDPADYASCFPYQSLLTDAAISLFYAFYRLD
jgi:hypothetical protein